MRKELKEILGRIEIPENEGTNKVASLKEAIRQHVKPGNSLHVGRVFTFPHASLYEVARQFWGTKPGFTLITLPAVEYATIWLHGGLLKKVITAFFGNGYPSPGPHWLVQKAYKEKAVDIECWSNLTICLMLMAGALDIGFMPTKSILGSGMEENVNSFRVTDDPFGSGRKFGLLKALNPDVSFIHAWAADRYGNTIFSPLYFEDVWGAMASSKVIVTVEHLVSTDFIRKHSDRVALPGFMVTSVSQVHFGAHPYGMYNRGLEEFDAYSEDYDFRIDFLNMKDEATLDAWIKKWVLDCDSHEDYLHKLGYDRLMRLKGAAQEDSWEHELESLEEKISTSEDYNLNEMMIVAAGKKIKEIVTRKGYKTMLAGLGASNLAAWIANYELKREGCDIDLLVEVGMGGYAPRPANPYLLSFSNLANCKSLTNFVNTLGVYCGGKDNQCLGVLAAGQVDKYGNINNTKLPEDRYLTGSGGSNDVASSARESVIVVAQSKSRFLEKVHYITSPGDRVKTLISTMGIFEKLGDDKEFTLVEYLPKPNLSKEEVLEEIRKNCGWELKVANGVKEAPRPTLDNLLLLRSFDPNRYFTEFEK